MNDSAIFYPTDGKGRMSKKHKIDKRVLKMCKNKGYVFSVDLVCKEELNLMLKVSDF